MKWKFKGNYLATQGPDSPELTVFTSCVIPIPWRTTQETLGPAGEASQGFSSLLIPPGVTQGRLCGGGGRPQNPAGPVARTRTHLTLPFPSRSTPTSLLLFLLPQRIQIFPPQCSHWTRCPPLLYPCASAGSGPGPGFTFCTLVPPGLLRTRPSSQ